MDRTAILNLLRAVNDVLSLRKELASMAAGDQSMAAMVLLSVLERNDQSRVGQLACILHVDMSVASRQVAYLQEQGLVERTPDPQDRRAQLVQVSGAGVAELERWRAAIADHFQQALADWSEDEADALTEQLHRLRHSLDQLGPSAPPDTTGAAEQPEQPAQPGQPEGTEQVDHQGRAEPRSDSAPAGYADQASERNREDSDQSVSTGEVTRVS